MAGPPGPGACPWAFFGYFLSQQKVTPRRGGETRQKTFRTRQDCEGADHRVAVKRKRDYHKRKHCTQNREADTFKKRPYGPVLKDRQTKPPAPGAPRGWVWASLVTGRGLSLRTDTKRKDSSAILSVVPYFYRVRLWKDTASSRSISPAAAVDQALSALDPDRTDVR